jgi:copper(I)-binding protein
MRAPLILAAGLAAALFATPIFAHDYTVGDHEVAHPYALESTGKTAAGYFSITNHGTSADRLLAIRADVPRSEVHTTETDASGVARMKAVEALEIPAGGTVALAPGGYHVMFMGLDKPLTAGETLPATLVFEKSGELAVDFNVQPRGDTAGGQDGHMPGMSH